MEDLRMKFAKAYVTMSILLLIVTGILCGKAQAAALTYTPEGADYSLAFEGFESDQTAILKGFAVKPTDNIPLLEIPAEVEGFRVVTIGSSAFNFSTKLTGTVVIPEGVEIIQSHAFQYCPNLKELVLPDSITTIENYAFQKCAAMMLDPTLPANLESIGASAFDGCTGMTGSLILPENLTLIDSSAFSGCTGLTGDLVIPNSVTQLGSSAFYKCSGFNGTLTLSSSLTAIPFSAFYGCSGFTGHLTLPDSITRIGYSAFENCSGFTGLTLPASLQTFESSAYNGCRTFYNCKGLSGTLVIPEGVTSIGSYTFHDCANLTAVEFPQNLQAIESSAFGDCSGLSGPLVLPDSLRSIGGSAFSYCSSLTSIRFPEKLETIGSRAFADCTALTGDLALPDLITQIESYAFLNCAGLTGTLTLPQQLQIIEDSAFRDCGFTGTLTLPEALTQIGKTVFTGSRFTGDLSLPDGLTLLGESAFNGCGFTGNLSCGSQLEQIPKAAFSGCGFSGTLTLPEDLVQIGESAFTNCPFTGDLVIPASVTTISKSAFSGCSGFTGTLTLPETLTKIGDSAFRGCPFTGDLTIPDSVTEIPEYAFYGGDFTGTLTLPEALKTIEESAFHDCSGFTGKLSLPETLTSIGESAFSGCSGFTGKLYLPDGMTSIGSSAFQNCSGLTGELVIPQGVTYIPSNTFENCSGFTSLTLPQGISSIGDSAFHSCSGLTGTLIIPHSVTSIEEAAFSYCYHLHTLYLPTHVTIHTAINSGSFKSCYITDIYYGGTGSDWTNQNLDNILLMIGQRENQDLVIHFESYTDKGLVIDGSAHTVKLGETLTLNAFWGGATAATDRAFSWSVSDPSVLALESSSCTMVGSGFSANLTATFRALKDGEVTVSAYGPNDASDSCTVTTAGNRVITYLPHAEQAEGKPLYLKKGESQTLTFSYLSNGDLNSELADIQWEVTGDDAAGISLQELPAAIETDTTARLSASVTGLTPGEPVTIRVFSPYGCEDSCQVQVVDESITILKNESSSPTDEVHRFRLTVGERLDLCIRYETALDEAAVTQNVNQWTWTMSTEDFLADPEMVSEEKTLAFRHTETALPMDLTCIKQSDGIYLIKASFIPAMEGVTALKVENEEGLSDLCLIYATFDVPLYRASLQTEGENQAIKQLNQYLEGDTPATLLIKSLDKTGDFTTAALLWKSLEDTFNALDNPASLYNLTVEEEDLYYALLADLFTTAYQHDLERQYQNLTTFCKNMNSDSEDVIRLLYGGDISSDGFKDWLAEKDHVEFLKTHKENSYSEKYKDFNTASKTMIGLDFLALGVDGYADYQMAITNAAVISAVTADMERVLEAMLAECPQSNPALQKALQTFLTHTQASEAELTKMLQDGSLISTGIKGAQTLFDVFWDKWESIFKNQCPEAALIFFAYKGSTTFCKVGYNTDETLEEHYKMLALQQIKTVARGASETLELVWKEDPSTQSAMEYLASIEVLNTIHDRDCQLALDFVDAVDKSWETALESSWNEIFGEGKFAGAIRAFEGYRSDFEDACNIWRATWIPNSAVDYPGTLMSLIYSEEYTEITGKPPIRVIRAACPVDVYVRNTAGELVSFAESGKIGTSSEQVAVLLNGDVKTFSFYDDARYTLDFIGTGTGTMDLTDTTLTPDGTVLRTVQYYDLPLTDKTAYTCSEPETLRRGTSLIRPGGDSQNSTVYPISMVSGIMNQTNGSVLSGKAYAGQLIPISACIPENGVFTGWTSSQGTDLFEDPASPVTTLRMPAGSVTVTAQYKLLPSPLLLTDESGKVLNEIPNGRFTACCSAPDSSALGLLAAYDADGRQILAAFASASSDSPRTHTVTVDHAGGNIALLKFFWLSAEDYTPLLEAAVFPKAHA